MAILSDPSVDAWYRTEISPMSSGRCRPRSRPRNWTPDQPAQARTQVLRRCGRSGRYAIARNQPHGLALAIPEPPRPCRLGIGRHQPASPLGRRDIPVADLGAALGRMKASIRQATDIAAAQEVFLGISPPERRPQSARDTPTAAPAFRTVRGRRCGRSGRACRRAPGSRRARCWSAARARDRDRTDCRP